MIDKHIIAVLVIIGVFLAYTTFIWFLTNEKKPKRGPLDSISDSVRVLKGPWVTLFSLFAIGLGAPLAVFLETSGLFFIPMVFLGLLAATPLFPDSGARHTLMHNIGATGAIVSILIIIWIVFGSWWWFVLAVIIAILLKRPKVRRMSVEYNEISNHTWWIQCTSVVCITLGLLIR